jgi:steroid delta-isomerase-like uncharacterized protein
MTLEDNKAIVRRFLEEGNREGKTPVELCAKDFTAHISGYPAMDLQSFQQYQVTYFASFSQSGIIIEDMIAEGNKVAFRGVVRAIHMREFMGTPSSGKQVVVSVIGFARLKEGKIEEWWNSPDRLSWMQQIGALPSTKLA